MMGDFRQWFRRLVTSAPRARDPGRVALADGMIEASRGDGPWMFLDPLDRRWVLSIAPLEHDATLPADRQLKALICSCEDGWIFAVPVGAEFRADRLEPDELCRLLVVAEGNARQVSDWEPSRSETRSIRDPETAREYDVQVAGSSASHRPSVEMAGAATGQALVFRERDGSWRNSIPLPAGRSIESLSREDLLRFLRHALELRPRMTASALRAAISPDAPREERTSVLLVEDEADLRTIYRVALERAGFSVIEAREGEEALSLVERHGAEIRAVVSDVVMPRVGGRELLWRLLLQRPGLPVILISGLLDEREIVGDLEAGPAWFLRKPFAPRELVEVMKNVLGGGPAGAPLSH